MFEINDEKKLAVLLKIFWTIKFDVPVENGIEIAGSPHVAELYVDAYKSMIKYLKNNGKKLDAIKLQNDLSGEHQIELEAVKRYLVFSKDKLLNFDNEEKKEFVKILISPFILSENDLEKLLDEI